MHDLRYAARQLRKSPLFTLCAILTLALGIGANAAIYQLLDTLFVRALPVHDPARLVRITPLQDGKPGNFSYPAFRDLAARQQIADGMIAISDFPLHAAVLRGRGQAHTVNAVLVTADYFRVLGVGAPVGRVFADSDDRASLAVISDAFWTREFGRSPTVPGQTLAINKSVVTVIGVAPPAFTGEKPGNSPDLWLPMGLAPQLLRNDWLESPKSTWLTAVARLRPDVTPAAARQSLEAIHGGALRVDSAARGVGDLQERFGSPVLVLMAAVGLVLLIACSNLATLLLGRAAARSQEMAVRMALGAGRARLIRQLLVESFLLAAIGAGLGLAFAMWAPGALVAQMTGAGSLTVEWSWRVLAVTAAATALATLLSGLAPALSATRVSRYSGPRRQWVSRGLIVAQVSISLLLLSGAGLLARSLWNLRHQDFGFRPNRLVIVDLPWEFSPAMMARYTALRQPLFDRMNALPGVESAALSGFGPLGDAQHTGSLAAPGQASRGARIVHVSPKFFETAGIPIVAGRPLTSDDRASAPNVAVLSETGARVFFGAEGAVGRRVSLDKSFDSSHAIEIVGVAHDVRFAHPADPFGIDIYVPLEQSPAPITAIAIRAAGDTDLVAREIRAALREVDPDLAVGAVRAAPDAIDALLGRERGVSLLASCFAGLALLLTSVGVYGSIAYAVERRTREIGVRMALGARAGQVTAMLVGELGAVVAVSAVLGTVGAIAAGRSLRGLLFGIPPDDFTTIAASVAALAIVAGAAAYLPARRAARLDPITALREE